MATDGILWTIWGYADVKDMSPVEDIPGFGGGFGLISQQVRSKSRPTKPQARRAIQEYVESWGCTVAQKDIDITDIEADKPQSQKWLKAMAELYSK